MDGSCFDRLTRDWSRGSRRAVLRGGIAAALGAALGRDVEQTGAASDCTAYQDSCSASEQCCSGLCVIGACAGLENGLACEADGACASGLCAKRKHRKKHQSKLACAACNDKNCPPGRKCVNGVCQIVTSCQNDDECPAKHICHDNKCVASCRKDKECPGGRCARTGKSGYCVPGCESDGDCANNQRCTESHVCSDCPSGQLGCGGKCLDLSVCPADEQHTHCNNSDGCICSRIADNNNTRFCAVSTTCDVQCGPGNSCPQGQACVMTCCDGPGNAGLRCLPSCG